MKKFLVIFLILINIAVAQSNKNGKQLYDLGDQYFSGRNSPESIPKALENYKLSAQKGYVKAQLKLGHLYSSGSFIRQDYDEAIKWYGMAAKQGNSEAQHSIGEIYEKTRDFEEAIKWYELADSNGEVNSATAIGYIYYNKTDLHDLSKAKEWFGKACDQGSYYDGCGKYKELNKQATNKLKANKQATNKLEANKQATNKLEANKQATNSFRPSFDCSKASTSIEKEICNDSELSSLDSQVADLYNGIKSDEKIRLSQREWLKKRNKAKTNSDLVVAYMDRHFELLDYYFNNRLSLPTKKANNISLNDNLTISNQTQQKYIQVSPLELINEFNNNEVRANKTYKESHYIILKGEVYNIEEHNKNYSKIGFKAGKYDGNVRVLLENSKYENLIFNLNKGDQLSVICDFNKIDRTLDVYFIAYSCEEYLE